MLCYELGERHVAQIESCAGGATVVPCGQDRIATEIAMADIFCGHAKVPVDWDRVVESGRLRWIQSSAAGLDHCLVPAVIKSDVMVTSASGLFADAVAEHALALLLGLLRSLPTFVAAQQRREYVRRATRDLHGKTVGIVGFGGNGRRIAQVLAPFRVRILATDMFPREKPDSVEQILPAAALDVLLRQADILILCVPLTHQTTGLIDRRAFALLKRDAILVNVARGAVVVEDALVDALSTGQLAGAGLDVAATEPLDATSPLWELSNVLITPHVAAQYDRRANDITDFFCQNLTRFLAGKRLKNLVDKGLGFCVPEGLQVPKPGFSGSGDGQ